MREAANDIGDVKPASPSHGGGRPHPHDHQPKLGKVWAIAERPVTLTDNPSGARVRSLLVTSRTPSQAEINTASGSAPPSSAATATSAAVVPAARAGSSRGSPADRGGSALTIVAKNGSGRGGEAGAGIVKRAMEWRKSHLYRARAVAPAPPIVASPGGSDGFAGGLLPRDVGKVVPLPELGTQPYSEKREFLCLTSAGLQTLAKLRPVDLLYDLLARNQSERVRRGCLFMLGGGKGLGGGGGLRSCAKGA